MLTWQHPFHGKTALLGAERTKSLEKKTALWVQRGQNHSKKTALFQKNPRVRKIRVRNSGAGNGCANFMDTWKKCVLSAGKTMSVKFLLLGGGGLGGGGADFIFMGARIFLTFGCREERINQNFSYSYSYSLVTRRN